MSLKAFVDCKIQIENSVFTGKWQRWSHHVIRIIGRQTVLVTNILKIIEEEETNNPEETHDDEHHHYQTTVQGTMHLQKETSKVL